MVVLLAGRAHAARGVVRAARYRGRGAALLRLRLRHDAGLAQEADQVLLRRCCVQGMALLIVGETNNKMMQQEAGRVC